MTRQQSVWFGTLIVMLMIGIWRFITAVVAAQNGWWAPVFWPILSAAAGAGLILYGWQAAVSGPFVLAGALLGMSVTFTLRILIPEHFFWLAGLSLVPGLAGAGMLVEISRGQGWRFTRRLSYGLLLTGMAMVLMLAISSWPNSL